MYNLFRGTIWFNYWRRKPEIKGAIYVDFSSPDEIKNAIQALSNDEKRLLLAQNAHDNINTNFSLERLSRKLKDLFEYAD